MQAFIRLAAQRGLDSTPTRLVAAEAGVSELTLFRLFRDKATLLTESLRYAAPTEDLSVYVTAIDASSPRSAAAGLARCFKYLRDQLRAHRDLLHFALAETRHHPELKDELRRAPLQAGALLESALNEAAPQLRPDLDRRAALLSLEGLLLLTVLWTSEGLLELSDAEWDALLEGAARNLIR
jgi:AcrR family transcriptional regulator